MAKEETSMKLYKNAIILLVILAILGGVYYYIDQKKPGTSNDTTSETITIFKTEKDNISEINIITADHNITFYKDGEEWKEKSSGNIKLVQSKIDNLAYDVATINAEQLVEENAKDLSVYGLTTPISTLNIKLTDGTIKTFYVGDKTPSKTAYYFQEKDQNTVYTIYSSKGDSFSSSLEEYRDKNVFTVKPEEITSIILDGTDRERLVLQAKEPKNENEEETAATTISAWDMLEPHKISVDNEDLHNLILSKLSGITVKDFVDDHPDNLENYGLDSPKYILELKDIDNKKSKLLIGKTENGSTYFQVPDSQSIYTIEEEKLAFKDIKPFDLIEKFAYIVNIDTVDKIEINADGKITTLEIIHKTEEEGDEYKVDGQNANESNFKKAYQAVIGLIVDEWVSSRSAALPT